MAELRVSSTFASGEVAGTPVKKGNVPSEDKDKVNSILDKLDGKAGFTIGDVVVLGKMNKEARATALGLDANKYDVKVDSKNGIINILEEGASWLHRDANKTQVAGNTSSTSRLAPQGQPPIKETKNKDGSISYTLPRRREGGSEWPGITQRVFNIKNGVINKIDIYDTDEYGEAKWHKVITIGNDGAATITEYEYDKKTGTSNEKFNMSRVRKYTNILLQGSYDKIVNNQNGIEIPALVF